MSALSPVDKARDTFLKELSYTFAVALKQDFEIKEKKAAKGGDDGKKKKAKKDAAPAVVGIQFGKGTRQFFDFLVVSKLVEHEDALKKFEVAFNKELASELTEILQVHNEERRRPKCAKGTRDMTPL
jgi:hypothetical protein